jgi:hypothetical protein
MSPSPLTWPPASPDIAKAQAPDFEFIAPIDEAIAHEKRLKRWHRDWKIGLIEKANPEWRDLYDDLAG